MTIMIPTYNQSEYILEAIKSALSQTYPKLEVIVGDDGSTDHTQSIVSTIEDKRLRYIRNPFNLGRTENYKNLLTNHAIGDYVVNLDGDDFFTYPEFISEAVELLKGDGNAVIVAAKVRTKSSSDEYISTLPMAKQATGMEILKKVPEKGYMFMHLGVLYKRDLAIDIDFYRSPAISSDWESLYRLALRGKVLYLDKEVGTWRVHKGNETATKDPKKLLENLGIWDSVYQDAALLGMHPVRAKYHAAKCITAFILPSCASVSRDGNWKLLLFTLSAFRKHWPSLLVTLVSPRSVMTLALCFLGYYRK